MQATVEKKTPVFNLRTKRDRERYLKSDYDSSYNVTLEEYLKGTPCNLFYGENKLFEAVGDCYTYVLTPDNRLLPVQNINYGHDAFTRALEANLENKDITPSAVLISIKKRANPNLRFMLLLNGDEDQRFSIHDSNDVVGLDLPTVSFRCLERFYPKNEAMQRLGSGDLKVVDFTSEENRYEPKAKCPEPGFTWHGGRWHRSGTVLFQDREHKICILMGQDEGTYFGVQLPKMCRTVQDAFEALIPNGAKGKDFIRQGEWFMVPCSEPPAHIDCVACTQKELDLPIETSDSNRHEVNSCDIRVGKDGLVYAYTPTVTHDEHREISANGWQVFYKNTALFSFSEKGVD